MLKLPFFQKEPQSATRFLLIGLNANDIKVLSIYTDEKRFKIIGQCKQELDPGMIKGGVIVDKESVETLLANAIAVATENAEENINQTIIGVNGDLSMGLLTAIRSKRPNSDPMSTKECDELFKTMTESAFIEAQNEYLQTTGDAETELELITSANVYLKADGQTVHSLENIKAHTIEGAVFNAFAPSFHLKSIQKLASKNKLKVMAVGAELYALTQYIKQNNPGVLDFIILDISGDSTNTAVIFGGGIVRTKNLNIGYTHFVEGISERMGLTYRESEKVIGAYIKEKLASSEALIVQNALRDTMETWIEGIILMFEEYSGVKTFPSKIFLTGIGCDIPDAIKFIQEENWAKVIPLKVDPEFEKVKFSTLNNVADATGKVVGSEWINIASLCKIYEEMGL